MIFFGLKKKKKKKRVKLIYEGRGIDEKEWIKKGQQQKENKYENKTKKERK